MFSSTLSGRYGIYLFCFLWMTLYSAVVSRENGTKDGECEATRNIKCKDGVMVPAWLTPGNESGKGWMAVKAFVYFISMFILFIGISIISDRFMEAIEYITSQEKEITVKDKSTGKKHIVTVKIWNETVANLSLMALGSSAPEILLSVIEIIGRGFVAGELGPSTIVGSAAFNLFMITAVCVSVLPDGETRRIKHLNVFIFTASCSVLAYVWLYIILAVSSPAVIEIWEGVITLICFPGMVGIAWMIDTNTNFYRYLRKKVRKTRKHGKQIVQTGDGDVIGISIRDGDIEKNHLDDASYDTKEIELLAYKEGDDPEAHMKEKKRLAMEAYRKAKEKYPDADSETLQQLVETENRKMQHKSRAYYRIQAVRNMTGQGGVFKKPDQAAIKQKMEEHQQQKEAQLHEHEEGVYFRPTEYTVVESCGTCYLTVSRHGASLYDTVEVDYETLDGSAVVGEDYEQSRGTLVFSPGETEKNIPIVINDDDIFELDEHFYCKLSNPRSHNKNKPPVQLGKSNTATVTILDDDYPGVFTIENPRYEVMESVGVLIVRIIRLIGARGVVRIPYHTEEGSAQAGGVDFEDCVGEVEFQNEEFVKDVEILIVDQEEYEKDKVFNIVLGEPVVIQVEEASITNIASIEDEGLRKILEAGKPALGENRSCEVHIRECQEFKNTIDSMLGKKNMASFLKSNSWLEQFKDAFEVSAGDDDDSEEDVEPSYYDYFMHYLSLFWKVLFALVPPTDIWGGWACFWVSISMIGLLTAVTGDVASHFGCTIGLADSVVAISFVALGTSLPDTFASKVATINDETADSSIGNVTGSNSVNVFLGIGLAWSVAAFYHTINGGEFRVNPGSLGFSVLVFCIGALCCISLMMFRRCNPNIGAELGGPKGWRIFTSTFCACLWLLYILLSSMQTYCHITVNF